MLLFIPCRPEGGPCQLHKEEPLARMAQVHASTTLYMSEQQALLWCSAWDCSNCPSVMSPPPYCAQVNMRGRLSKAMQLRHPAAPVTVQWHSGALLLLGGACRPATELRAGFGCEGVGSSCVSAEITSCGLPCALQVCCFHAACSSQTAAGARGTIGSPQQLRFSSHPQV